MERHSGILTLRAIEETENEVKEEDFQVSIFPQAPAKLLDLVSSPETLVSTKPFD